MDKRKYLSDESWIYILLETTLAILLETIKVYKLEIFKTSISYSMFLLPIVLFISHYLIKKYNYKHAIAGVFISSILTLLFIIIMSFTTGKTIILSNYIGDSLSYIISQFINIIVYTFIINNTKSSFVLIFLNYILSLIFFHMVYTLSYINYIDLNGYWYRYFVTLGLQMMIFIPLTIIDKNHKIKI